MKSLFLFTSFLLVFNSMAQKINGKYQGELAAANQSKLESSMMLTVKGTVMTGTMTLSINGTNITSTLSGNLSDGVYKGTLTNETGTANFSLQDLSTLGAGMTALFVQVIDQGQVILSGMFEKAGAASKPLSNTGQTPNVAASGSSIPKANGSKIVDKVGGFSFNVPVGFSNSQEANGAYLLRKGQDPSGISVSSTPNNDPNAVYNELSQPSNVNGIVGNVYEAPQKIGNTIISACHVFNSRGRNVYYYFVSVFSAFESGALILLVSEVNPPAESWKSAALSVAKSVSFFKAEKSALAQQIEQTLRGRGLRHLKVSNYRTEDWRYDFCSDGTYAYNSGGQLRSPGETTLIIRGDNNYNTGTWRVITRGNMAYVVLTSQGGTPVEWPIEFAGRGDVYLNKVLYGLTDNQICR